MDLVSIRASVPIEYKDLVNQELLDKLNELESNPILLDQIRETFVGYISVLKGSQYTLRDYLHIVTYITHRLRGEPSLVCYSKAYPDRYANLVSIGTPEYVIKRHASMVEKGKLYNVIMQQVIVPSWILNHDTYQEAIAVQVELMRDAKSELVRQQAANSLLTHLARPKEVPDVLVFNNNNTSGSDSIDKLTEAMNVLANMQQGAIIDGVCKRNVLATSLSKGDEDDNN